MPEVSIVGLGPSDARLLTIGALDCLRSAATVFTCNAAPATLTYLREAGIAAESIPLDAGALLRGVDTAVDAACALFAHADGALGVPGHPLLDFPGLPNFLHALSARGITAAIVPGMPRSALAAAAMSPLLPLPPVATHHTWDELVEIMARLRACCPWDREQTHATLLPYLVEETHEVVEAVDERDARKLCEELGDLLLQIIFHSQIACERGQFSVADVVDALANKMIRRHPHVFGDASISTTQEQMKSWELIKTQEDSMRHRESLLDGVPKSLPALLHAQRIQEKATTVGFDWTQARDIVGKLEEELAELRIALRRSDPAGIRDELGDVLFTVVNLARRSGLDAEAALRQANMKFRRRFAAMEHIAGGGAASLANRTLADLDRLWEQAKDLEAGKVP
jgi:tetrapyrrole methylase family protein/MazG family protein